MPFSCPNKNTPEWKRLFLAVGKDRAYELYTENNFDIPTNFVVRAQDIRKVIKLYKTEIGQDKLIKVKKALDRYNTVNNTSHSLDITPIGESTESKVKLVLNFNPRNAQKYQDKLDRRSEEDKMFRELEEESESEEFARDIDYFMGDEQLMQQEDGVFYQTDRSIKPGVQELFESNPELANIGTQQQYSQYLDTIFPDSKVKDIVYHHSSQKLEKFDKSFLGKETNAPDTNLGFFFAEDRKDIPRMVADKNKQLETIGSPLRLNFSVENHVLINLKNPKYYYGFIDSAASDEINKYAETSEDYKKARKSFEEKGFDSLIYGLYIEPDGEGGTDVNHGYVVFEPEQIHILSSKQDIQGFKEFVQGKQSITPRKGISELFSENPQLASIGTQQQYSQYLDTIFPDSKVKEMDSSLYISVLNQLEQENKIEKDCSGGKLKAKDGIRGKFTKGSQWEIVKDLKGYPSHSQGGVDVKIGKNGFSFTRDNGVIEAKYGLVLPKIK